MGASNKKPEIGDVIAGRYELLSHLGTSPTRIAFLAFDQEVEVEVTLWWISEELFSDELGRETFEYNVRAMRKVRHPNLLRVFDFGRIEEEAIMYVTLQLGTSSELEDRLRDGKAADDEEFLRYANGLANAVEAAYQQGYHHSWLCPADVVEVKGQVKLCGVGLFGATIDSAGALEHWGTAKRYLAPEVLAGAEGSPASDWYSIAVLLLDLATGKSSETLEQSKASLQAASPERMKALEAALQHDPNARPSEAREFLAPIRLAWMEEGVDEQTITSGQPVATPKPALETDDDFSEATVDDVIGGRKLLIDDDEPNVKAQEPEDSLLVSEVVRRPTLLPEEEQSIPDVSKQEIATKSYRALAPQEIEEGLFEDEPEEHDWVASSDEADAAGFEDAADTFFDMPANDASARDSEKVSEFPSDLSTEERYFNPSLPDRGNGFFNPLTIIVFAAIAGIVAYFVSSSGSSDTSKEAEQRQPQADSVENNSVPEPQEKVVLVPTCPEKMLHLKERGVCIDSHEEPGAGRRPTVEISLEDARAVCTGRGARLCTAQEWEQVCRQKGSKSWPYGDRYQSEICNLKSDHLLPTGHEERCQNKAGVFDMSGNVAEWVEEGQIRGGSGLDGTEGRCSESRSKPMQQSSYSDVGFRCCADPVASQASSD